MTLGLPAAVRGCLFDMDGVLTQTASVHAAAWQQAFDEFLAARSAATGGLLRPFDPVDDYDRFVDGRRRDDGTRAFLDSRGIDLPEGQPEDPPGTPTIHGIGNRKNDLVLKILDEGGVQVFDGSVRYVQAARDAGLRRAVVSSSTNTVHVLEAGGILDLFEAVVDGIEAMKRGLAGKPEPDMYLAGAQALGLTAAEAAVFEDALAGVAAGRAGGFACVIGVDRVGQADALRAHGATTVVRDLSELLPPS